MLKYNNNLDVVHTGIFESTRISSGSEEKLGPSHQLMGEPSS